MFRTVPTEVFVALPITAFAAMIANLVLADRLYQIKYRTPGSTRRRSCWFFAG